MVTNYPINPRVRAFGRARLDFADRAKNQMDWETRWISPSNPFPFDWGESWKQCVEYRVDDFPAEVGFFIDVLGFSVNALDHAYAMFTSPQADFFISIVPTPHNEPSTPPDAIHIQFMVKDIILTTQTLLQRGISFDHTPQPLHPGSTMFISSFRTPHGVSIELWGKQNALPTLQPERGANSAIYPEDGDDAEEDDDYFDGEDDIDEHDGKGGHDSEDEFDEGDGNGVLAGEDDESDDDEDPGSGEEIDEEEALPVPDKEEDDDDEDELWEKKEFDEDQYGSDWDEDDDDDDDDYGGDEDLKRLNSPALQDVTFLSRTLPEEVKPALPSNALVSHTMQEPEYNEFDITLIRFESIRFLRNK